MQFLCQLWHERYFNLLSVCCKTGGAGTEPGQRGAADIPLLGVFPHVRYCRQLCGRPYPGNEARAVLFQSRHGTGVRLSRPAIRRNRGIRGSHVPAPCIRHALRQKRGRP